MISPQNPLTLSNTPLDVLSETSVPPKRDARGGGTTLMFSPTSHQQDSFFKDSSKPPKLNLSLV